MKRKYLGIFCALMMALLLCSCSSPSPTPTPAPTQKPAANNYVYTPPEGFTVDPDNELMYYAPTYPQDASNINIVVSAKDSLFMTYTESMLKEPLIAQLEQQLTGAQVTFEKFSRTTVAGLDAIRLETTVTMNDINMRIVQFMVDGDKTFTFTLTQVSGANWVSKFEASVMACTFN